MRFNKKFILSSLIALVFATNSYCTNIDIAEDKMRKAYELGHFHGVTQVTREFDLEMFNRFKGGLDFQQYIVAINIKKLPLHKILLYKTYALAEGLAPVTTSNNLLVFASYKREVDANYLVEEVLKPGYFSKGGKDEKVFIINNKAQHKYSYAPFIYNQLLDSMEKEIKDRVKSKVYILNAEPKKSKPKKVTKPKKKKTVKLKYFKVPNKVAYYKYEAGATSIGKMIRSKKKFNEDNFNETGYLTNPNKKYKFANIVTSTDDVKYIKVYNVNLFVELEDVKLIKN